VLKNVKNIVVLGAGESGVGAALLAKAKGFNVFVSDFGSIKDKYKIELSSNEISYEEGQHSTKKMDWAELFIKSPGIPNSLQLIKELKTSGRPVIGEIEFAYHFTKAKIIAITGSNGKTTTTNWVYHVLKNGGLSVDMCGNVGESFARKLLDEPKDFYVLELSSFQLEDTIEFKADIAILLNIVADHLDRYEYDIEKYASAKLNILKNQNSTDWFIYNSDDERITSSIKNRTLQSNIAPFSLQKEVVQGAYMKENQIIINIKNKLTMSIHDLALKGRHNVQNALASGIAGRVLDIRKSSVRESLSDFTNVEHRLEFVAKVNGIEFINDSKATNINATWFALESMDKPTVWIVGGVDKGNDYDELMDLAKDKVKAIVCLGKDNQKIIDYFEDHIDQIVEASSAFEAVGFAYQLARKDETVLLSPACASFDLFENYEDRGNQFKHAVRSL
jgi:UDP-N-acetylmuramoylalanine--D-glutamate ligase